MNKSIFARRAPADAEPIRNLVAETLELSRAAAPGAGAGSVFVARVRSKKELAALYGYGRDTFRRRLQGVGLGFGRVKLLTAGQVEDVVRALGPPSYEFTAR